ncbi:SLATT domain-containing protein [Streptomyces viridochromogenes]|uniref:SLATT domain-containing protein n=1 Tax=Streptomyces viridochromogenes TaxID=1938 RepID=UPI00117F65E7|nr:SLATT domain-containing protein [Streptomyces viridochromogenes]
MDEEQALAYVEEQLNNHIGNFKSSKKFFRRLSMIETVSAATLGAITTLFVALSHIFKVDTLEILALIFAALTTVAAAWVGWFSSRQSWVSKQTTLNSLYSLRARISFDKASNMVAADKIEKYNSDLQQILDHANREWQELRGN